MFTTRQLAFSVAFLLTLASSVRSEMLFYASFDKSQHADFAVGNRNASGRQRGKLLDLTTETRGDWGRALNAAHSDRSRSVRFDTPGNVDLRRGTIEFFAKVNPFTPKSAHHTYFRFVGAGTLGLSLGRRGNGQGLVLGFNINGQTGWDYYSERFVAPGQWQHFAVTWDLTKGAKRGTFSVFVDGIRRLHTDKVNPYRWGLESLYVGGRNSSNGFLDDFAIFNDIRRTKNFTPPTQPLRSLAIAAAADNARNPAAEPIKPRPLGHAFLNNAGFEKWSDGRPVGWTLDRGEVRPELTMTMNGRRSLALMVDRKETHPWPLSRISSAPFVLKPNTEYRLSVWASMPDTVGDMRFEVAGADDGEVASYRSGWCKSHPWLQLTETFRTRDSRQFTVSISAQSTFGSPVWIDDITIEPVGTSGPIAADPDSPDQLPLFTRSVMESLELPRRPPSGLELIDSLRIRLARGEFEPGLVGLHTPDTIDKANLRLASELVGPDGAVIPVGDVTVRRLDGGLLPLARPKTIPAGDVAGWWVTPRTRPDTRPGLYRGTLEVTSADNVLRKLPLEVEVMDVVLPEPDIAFLMYHHEHYFPDNMLTPELQKAYYRDMREHGMNTVTVYNNGDVDGSSNINFAKNYNYKSDNPRFQYGLETQMKWILESGLCATGQPVLWLPAAHGYGWGGLPEPALKASLTNWKNRKWPKPLLYVNDEPGGEGPRFDAAVKRLKQIRSWNLPVRTTTAGLDPKKLGQYYNVWIAGDAGVNIDTLNQSKELDADLWTYNCTCPHLNMPFSRAFFGFWAFRTKVRGVAQWAYYDNPHWTANRQGEVGGNPKTRLSRICPSPDGPIPTISWEATREGIDDYRYTQLLQQLTVRGETRLKLLKTEAETLLSKKDRETIEARERQKLAQIDPKKPPITWKPANPEQARGEQSFLESRQLDRALQRARHAIEFVIGAIPYDAMSSRIFLSYQAPLWTRFCPPLGPGGLGENPRTATEVRRRILTSYILALKLTLRDVKDKQTAER
tara:strand:- start:2624 stop:5671 length:3048 start_codon:yes stop_codon:yes gene_type:complete